MFQLGSLGIDCYSPFSGFEFVDDFLGENVGIGEVVGFFAAFVGTRSISSRVTAGEIGIVSPESR